METRKGDWPEGENFYYGTRGIQIEEEDFKRWKLRFQETFNLLENN